MNPVKKLDWYTRETIKSNPKCMFCFGDNLKRVGLGGQAGAARGEPNTFGIPTKVAPGVADSDYFTDNDFLENVVLIDYHFEVLRELSQRFDIVFPTDGIGTGLAALDEKAPDTFRYLRFKIDQLVFEGLAPMMNEIFGESLIVLRSIGKTYATRTGEIVPATFSRDLRLALQRTNFITQASLDLFSHQWDKVHFFMLFDQTNYLHNDYVISNNLSFSAMDPL